MRHVCSAAAALTAFVILAPTIALGQAGSGLSITNYQLVDEQRVTRTQWYVTYRADLVNRSSALLAVTATVNSLAPTVEVVAGQGMLHFPMAAPNAQVTSLDTFTLLVDRSVPFDFGSLSWSFLNPVANAGPNQTAPLGKTVILNGSASSNPSGVGSLTYSWSFKSRPMASNATISTPSGVGASFVVDAAGTYSVMLTVSNGVASDMCPVFISTINSPPVANAGPNQTVSAGSAVTLNGSGSSDVDGNPLTYLWSFVSQPSGSTAVLSNLRSPIATFVADKSGTFIIQLVVNDGVLNSAPVTVTVNSTNTPPVANAGPNQFVNVASLVQLNGSGSTDVDGNPLTYRWTFNSVPANSTASMSNSAAVNPTFTADRPGTYVAQLIVNDGSVDSAPSTVTVTTNAPQSPVANAGPNQTVGHGAIVTLSGSGTDPQSLPLTLTWALTTRPTGSTATLSSTTVAHPTFVADQPGAYVAQLIVGNGYLNSSPSTVTITTTNTAPIASAGNNQTLAIGSTVHLDGSGSSDADHDPLTYSWSLITRPASSTTLLQGAVTSTPSFYADTPGTYVAQLIVNDGWTSSAPATVTITASQMKVTLTPNPLELTNSPRSLTISLSAPAGAGGAVVNLTGFDPAVISLPSSVTVPENSTGANVTVTPLAAGSTFILASTANFQSGSTTVNVTSAAITLALSYSAVGLTRSIDGTVTLSSPAPAAGAVVSFSSNPVGAVTFNPATITIAAGNTSGTFKVVGGTEGSAVVTASSSSYISGTASILVVSLGAIQLPSNLTVPPGQTVALDVKLSTAAPANGVTVTLTGSDTSILEVPATAFFPQGATSPTPPVQVKGIAFGSVTVTASAGGFAGDSKLVKVGGTLSFSPQAVSVGAAGDQSMQILLSAPAPAGGLSVTLQSSDTAVATVPQSVTIPANSTTSPSVLVHGVAPGSATITASTAVPNIASATLPVTVATFGSISLPSGIAVGQGQSVAFPVTLSAAAPAGGTTVTLSTSNSGIVDIQPRTVNVPAGLTQPATQPQVTGNGLGQATITASAGGYGSTSQTVQGNTSLTFTPGSLALSGTETKDLTLTLGKAAPASGLTVNLSASPAGVVTIPASVSIAAGATTATVHVTGATAGSATIRATAPNVTDATASVTVTTGADIVVPATVAITPGDSTPFQISLARAAQSTVFLELTTSDATKATVSPATIAIAAGQTQSATAVRVYGVSNGSATITVKATNVTLASATSTVNVGYALTITPANLTISGNGNQSMVTLTLSGPAPAGGIDVTLSSSNTAVATVVASVSISATSTSVSARVISVGVGTTTITARAPGMPDATSTVTVTPPGSISISAPATIGLSETGTLNVTLSSPATFNGVTVDLVSSDAAIVSVSPTSVTIPAGGTTPVTQPQLVAVNVGSASISASATGYTSPTPATVQVNAKIGWMSPLTDIAGIGKNAMLQLKLYAMAPMAGLTINLRSSNSAVVTVQSTASIIWDGSTAPIILVQVTSAGLGTAVIHASGLNIPDVTTTVTVSGSLQISTTSLANGVVGTAYSGAFAAIGGTPPYTWSATGLPSGLTINTSTGAITGTPDTAGTATVNVTVTDSSSPSPASVSKQVPLTVIQTLAIITSTLPNGATGVAYNGPVSAIGGTTPFTWTATGLPSGLTIDSATGVISGTPTQSGPATINVTVTDSSSPTHLSATKAFQVTIAPALNITTASLPNAFLGAPYSAQLNASGGTQPYTWASSRLPEGLTFDTATGAVSGTPIATGTSAVSFTVTDSASPTHASVSKIFSITISAGVSITTATLPNGIAGAAYSGSLAAAGGTPPYTWAATGLPAGLAIDAATGAISGTPTTAGAATINVTATDSTTPTKVSGTKSFSVTIGAGLSISTASLPNGIVGAVYNGALAASGGTSPYTWAATGLPAGLGINSTTGAISGTPTAAGPATIGVTATDSTNPTHLSATKSFSITIAAGVSITTATLPNGVVGAAYSAALTASGGTSPYTWAATGLPAGLAIDSATGAITGTPTTAGSATINVTATDSTTPTHLSAAKSFSVTIGVGFSITTGALPNGIVGASYSASLAAAGGASPYTWAATGLPTGLAINSTSGAITGTPTTAGPATINVTATDSTSPTHLSATKSFSITIGAGVSITTATLPNGIAGASYSAGLAAAGGTSPYTWAATGLPAGLAIDPVTGAISGTPTAAGPATIGVTATDSTSPTHLSATKSFSITIAAGVSITTGTLPNGIVGASYSAAMAASGGTSPYTWSATGLPTGLGINSTTGAITGSPTAAGPATINVTATDSTSPTPLSATKGFSITIGAGLAITTPTLPNGVAKSAYSFTMTASGGTSPYTWSSPDLPPGLSIDGATGAITGTTQAAGTTSVHITVTDATAPTHLSVTAPFSLTMTAALALTTNSLPNGVAGVAYNTQATASGGTPPYAWTAANLPSGLTIDPLNGTISGTVAAVVTATVTLTVTDATMPTHQTVSKDLSLTIGPALALTTSVMPNGVVGSTYNASMAATGGTQPYVWTQTGLPAGLTIDASSGAISGNPTAPGPATVNITVTDATAPTHQSVSRAFSITIAPALSITTQSLPAGTQGAPYTGSAAATGGTTPYAWSATGLPTGLAIDAGTGAITGTPSVLGSFTITVSVTDSTSPVHQSVSKAFPVTINPGTLSINSSSLPGGQVGVAYNFTPTASGGTPALHWSATGLPNGLSINANTGQITGTPTAGGTSSVTLSVSDSGTPVQNATRTLSLVVQSLSITTSALPAGQTGVSYSYQLTATGGTTPLNWSAPALPRGMTLNAITGVLSGSPTFPGTNTLTFTVTDASNPPQSASKDLVLTVTAQPLAMTTTSLPDGQVNTIYTPVQLTATGGTLPYVWTSTTLPAGLALSSSGVLSGTPTAQGSTNVTITVTDGGAPAQQVSKLLSLTINTLATAGTITVSNATVGQNLQVPITITFSPVLPASTTVTISSSDPGLITLGTSGVAGTGSLSPTLAAGTETVSVYVKAFGSSGQVSVNVSAPSYRNATGIITLAQSGFVIAGNNGIGGSISTYSGVSSTLTISAARLDSSGLFVEVEQVRGEYTANVPVSSTVTSVGNVSVAAVAFSGGMTSATLQFLAATANTGVTNVVVGPVPGFTQPAAGASLVATVLSSGLVPFTATIGRNLQKNVTVSRNGSTSTSAVVTIHSQDAAKLKFSNTPTGTASDTITVTMPQFQSFSPEFYAHVYVGSGPVAYTISSPAYGSVDSTVDTAPSGIIVHSPFGDGVDFSMNVGSTNATLDIKTWRLNGTTPVENQAVAVGASIPVTVTVDNTAVGNITLSPITIVPGAFSASTEFHAASIGSAHITASSAGYGSSTVGVTTLSQTLLCADGLTIGRFLQDSGSVIIPGGAPSGGLQLTLTSNSPLLALSSSATAAGSGSLTMDLAANATSSALYYLQALGSSGSVTYTASAPGYTSRTCTVNLTPSGIAIVNYGSANLTAGGSPATLTVLAAQLDAVGNPISTQALAGGAPLVVSLVNSNRAAGTVPATVSIAPNTDRSNLLFTPVASGRADISVTQPVNWTVPTAYTSTTLNVQ